MYPGYNMIINTILFFYAIKKLDADSSKQVRRGGEGIARTGKDSSIETSFISTYTKSMSYKEI